MTKKKITAELEALSRRRKNIIIGAGGSIDFIVPYQETSVDYCDMSGNRDSNVSNEESHKHKKTASLLQIPEEGNSNKFRGVSSSKSSDANLSGSDTASKQHNNNEIPINKSFSQNSLLCPITIGKNASGESSDERGDQPQNDGKLPDSRESSFDRSFGSQEANQDLASRKLENGQMSESNKNVDQESVNSVKSSQKEKKDSKVDKKRNKSWYNMINPNYKTRSEYLKRLFDLPADERLIVDYSCALQRDILVHGRLYVTQNYFFFYSKIFGWETFLKVKCKDIVSITKGKTALVIPNALQINTENDKHFLTSFAARDKTYLMLFRIWQNVLLGQQISPTELWQWVHISYGEELGLTSDDDDYIAPSTEDDAKLAIASGDLDKVSPISRANSTEDATHSPANSRPASSMEKSSSKKSSPKKYGTGLQGSKTCEPENDLPTDLSDSYESDVELEKMIGPEIIFCPNVSTHHVGREALNSVYPLPIDTLFTLLFTNSKFMLDLHISRKTTDIVCSDWQANKDTNQRIRQVTYTLTLPTNSLGPKVSHVTETQVMASFSTPGEIYSIDVEASNRGIPYAESFFVSTHWCLTKLSPKETRLAVWCEVRYKKNVFGFMKAVIDKNAYGGVDNLMNDLNNALLIEIESMEKKSSKKRRRRGGSKGGSELSLDRKSFNVPQRSAPILNRTQAPLAPSVQPAPPASSFYMTLMLSILVFLTAFLCYRLTSLEDKLSRNFLRPHFDSNAFRMAADGNHELLEQWIEILQYQEHLHNMELETYQQKMEEAASHLQKAEMSLRNLRINIPSRQSSKMEMLLQNYREWTAKKDQKKTNINKEL